MGSTPSGIGPHYNLTLLLYFPQGEQGMKYEMGWVLELKSHVWHIPLTVEMWRMGIRMVKINF